MMVAGEVAAAVVVAGEPHERRSGHIVMSGCVDVVEGWWWRWLWFAGWAGM